MMFMITMPPTTMPMATTAGTTVNSTAVSCFQNDTKASEVSTEKLSAVLAAGGAPRASLPRRVAMAGAISAAVRHLHRDLRRLAAAVQRLEGADRHQGEAVERLTEHAALGRDRADDRELLAADAHLPGRRRHTAEQLVGDVGADDDHGAAFADVDVAERLAGREAIVLDHLVLGRDAEHEHVAERPVAPDDVGVRRGPPRREPDGLGVRERRSHHLGIGRA